ncbi:Fic family protein [Microbacterium sp.]|uniref:Fic family protein n=1 Tax=Microbacterium sp. TaxID=51671 RepID=UPI003C736841
MRRRSGRRNSAGRFRREGEWVRVGSHLGANPAFVPELVDRALERYRTGQPGPGDILERIPWFHGEFETIHPFVDGNGRIGRGVPRSARNPRRARESQGVDSVHILCVE